MRNFIRYAFGLSLVAAFSLVLLAGPVAVGLADPARVGLPSRALTVLDSNDHLHYGVHLGLGLALGLCPCTRQFATTQYDKATWHARSPRQMALVTIDQPRTLGATIRDGLYLGASSLKWIGNAVL